MSSNNNFGERRIYHADRDVEVIWDALPRILSGQLEEARDNLLSRGLTLDEIERLGYRVIPPGNQRAMLNTTIGRAVFRRERFIDNVFNADGGFRSTVPSGIVFPQRNLNGDVIGLKERKLPDEQRGTGKGKFRQLSRHAAGGHPIHCPNVKRLFKPHDELEATYRGTAIPEHAFSDYEGVSQVWWTEGEIKADIATLRGAHYVIGLPGVEQTPDVAILAETIVERFPNVEFIIAFDNENSERTRRKERELAERLSNYAPVRVAVWEGPKGLDEAIIAKAIFAFREPNSDHWRNQLELGGRHGDEIVPNRSNLALVVRNLGPIYNVGLDEFVGRISWRRENTTSPQRPGPRRFEDTDTTAILLHASNNALPEFGTKLANEVIEHYATVDNRFNSFTDWANGIEWDGVERLPEMLHRVWSAEPTTLNAAIGEVFMIGAARRGLEPGAKQDHMMILEGEQGVGKSLGIQALSPRREWWSDSFPESLQETRRIMEAMTGKLIMEVPELSVFASSDFRWNRFKSVVTSEEANVRAAYAHFDGSFKRTTSLIGTTNDRTYLSHEKGQRRFLPVVARKLDLEWLKANRDQLWAEAVQKVRLGAVPLMPDAILPDLFEMQSTRQEDDAHDEIRDFCRRSIFERPVWLEAGTAEGEDIGAKGLRLQWMPRDEPRLHALPTELLSDFDIKAGRIRNGKALKAFVDALADLGFKRNTNMILREDQLRKWWTITLEDAEKLR